MNRVWNNYYNNSLTKSKSAEVYKKMSACASVGLTQRLLKCAKSKALVFEDIYIRHIADVYKRKTKKSKWVYSHTVVTANILNANSEIIVRRFNGYEVTNSKKFYCRFVSDILI